MNMLKSALSIASAALLLTAFGFAAQPEQATKDRMKSDLDTIRNIFDVEYAPKDWKLEYSGWDLDAEIDKAKEKIQNTAPITIKAYQRIVKEFFNSLKDYHVEVFFYSSEAAALPFRVKSVNGRYFFTWIDTERLSPRAFPINIGDELVMFDGKPTDDVIKEIGRNEMKAHKATDQGLVELFLTERYGFVGHRVPRGPVMIKVKSSYTNTFKDYQLIWDYWPEKISNDLRTAFEEEVDPNLNPKDFVVKKMASQNMVFPLFDQLMKASPINANSELIDSKVSYIPKLGRIWWSAHPEGPFDAYLYETDNRRLIGYLRIPHYRLEEEEIEELAKIISLFEERSDALVIDQINNSGGRAFVSYSIASMLTETPLHTPKHRFTITQESVFDAIREIQILEKIANDEEAVEELGETVYGMPVTYQMVQFLINFDHFIIDEWKAGRTLTNPFYLAGVDRINPNPTVRYTKPILVLVNNLDFSCGDFFPAIMQDNQRAVIFGERTAGAGGYVTKHYFSNRFGIRFFTCTGSIAERINKNPIENLGVTPDIPYKLTESDLKYGYQDYAQAINDAVQGFFIDREEPEFPSFDEIESEMMELIQPSSDDEIKSDDEIESEVTDLVQPLPDDELTPK